MQKLEKKEAKVKEHTPTQSPWIDANSAEAKKAQRVKGWRGGQGLKDADVRELVKTDSAAKADYVRIRREVAKAKKTREDKDFLAGLPATWQAFYNTVPHLDAQTAYKQHRKELQRQEKAEAVNALLGVKPVDDDADEREMELEVARLEAEVQRKKAALEERTKAAVEMAAKVTKVRRQDKDEEGRSKKLQRRLEDATYQNGVARGKLRSSEMAYGYAYQDTVGAHHKQVATLSRAVALTEAHMSNTKEELRQMIKAFQEAATSTTNLGSSHREGPPSSREG